MAPKDVSWAGFGGPFAEMLAAFKPCPHLVETIDTMWCAVNRDARYFAGGHEPQADAGVRPAGGGHADRGGPDGRCAAAAGAGAGVLGAPAPGRNHQVRRAARAATCVRHGWRHRDICGSGRSRLIPYSVKQVGPPAHIHGKLLVRPMLDIGTNVTSCSEAFDLTNIQSQGRRLV